MCVVNFFKFIFMPRTSHISLSSAIALSGTIIVIEINILYIITQQRLIKYYGLIPIKSTPVHNLWGLLGRVDGLLIEARLL